MTHVTIKENNSNIQLRLMSLLEDNPVGILHIKERIAKKNDGNPIRKRLEKIETVIATDNQSVSLYNKSEDKLAKSTQLRRILKRRKGRRKGKGKGKGRRKRNKRKGSKFGLIGYEVGPGALAKKKAAAKEQSDNEEVVDENEESDGEKKKKRKKRRKKTTSSTKSGSNQTIIVANVDTGKGQKNSQDETDSQNTSEEVVESKGAKKEKKKYEDERSKFLETLKCIDIEDVDDIEDKSNVPKCILTNLDNAFEKDVACAPDREDYLLNINYRLKVMKVEKETIKDKSIILLEKLLSIGDTAEFAGPINQLCFFKMTKDLSLTIIYPDRVPFMKLDDILIGNTEYNPLRLPNCKLFKQNVYDSAVWRFHVGKAIIGAVIRLISNCMYIRDFDNMHIEFLDQFTPRIANLDEIGVFCKPKTAIRTKKIYDDVFLFSEPSVDKLTIEEDPVPDADAFVGGFKLATLRMVEDFFTRGSENEIGNTFDNLLTNCRESLKRLFIGPGIYKHLYKHKQFTLNTKLLEDSQTLIDLVFIMYDITESIAVEYDWRRTELKVEESAFMKIGSFITGEEHQEVTQHCKLESATKKLIKKDSFKKAQVFDFHDTMMNEMDKQYGKCIFDLTAKDQGKLGEVLAAAKKQAKEDEERKRLIQRSSESRDYTPTLFGDPNDQITGNDTSLFSIFRRLHKKPDDNIKYKVPITGFSEKQHIKNKKTKTKRIIL